jgi:hypothetical protein
MFVSHTLSMTSPLIYSVTKSFIFFYISLFPEHATSFWKVFLAALASFSSKIILSRDFLTS